MAKCKVCGFRLSEGVTKCPMCGAEAGSTVAGEISSELNIAKYFCPSCKAQILGEHRYCPNCGVDIKEAAKKNKETQSQNLQGNKCIKCGAVLPENAKFCNECGAKQDTEKNLKTSQLTMVSPSQNNIQNVSCNLPETPLDAFEYEEKNGKFILKKIKDQFATEVVIPRTFSEIGEWAFNKCTELKSVIIPYTITKIGSFAFGDCRKLTHIEIPNSVTRIEYAAFGHSGLLSIDIPNSITKIDLLTFINCDSLKKVIIPDSVKEIDYQAFANCTSLEEIYIPDSVEIIEQGVFSNCKNLKSVRLPSKLTDLGKSEWSGENVFYSCTSLESIVLPDSITNIRNNNFFNCKNLINVKLSNSLKWIGAETFRGCKKLQNITIPDSVIGISWQAFSECKSLERIVIPKSVTKIGYAVFVDCTNLRSLIIENNMVSFENSDAGLGDVIRGCNRVQEIKIGDRTLSMGDIFNERLKYERAERKEKILDFFDDLKSSFGF